MIVDYKLSIINENGYEATFTDTNDKLSINERKETFWRVERPQIVFGKVYSESFVFNLKRDRPVT
jgi:hypothetical protein